MDNSNNDRPEGWGSRGPKPKQPTEATIIGLPVGRDKTVVPPDQVLELAQLGLVNKEIANFFGVTEDAISRNFAAELVKGREMMKIKLRRAMFKNACDHMNAAVQIFLAKNILGMSSEPMDSSANTPLPWNETDDTLVEIGEEHDEEN
jgi:hypothetical protein